MATVKEARPVDYRRLMKKVERFVDAIERSDDLATTIQAVSAALVAAFRAELGILGGRLYRREGSSYALQATFPDAKPIEGVRVPRSYRPIELLLETGVLYMQPGDPALDPELERTLGVHEFAAIEIGDEEYLLAFDVRESSHREDVQFSLGIIRHAINQKIHRERMAGVFNEARKIQSSILPRRAPIYAPYEIAGRSQPMESVGGDFFDFIPLTDKILGIAIADVSGHGLPAALQVRDIYTGLRMGMARDFKIVRTVERLNRIIHESTLTSRFVSMFYGELELNGLFIYVNAGHPPPFRLRAADGGVDYLEEGGAVLGPLPEATYERGFVTLRPGDVVVLYTDGIVEALGTGDGGGSEEFGVERLIEVVARERRRPAAEIVDRVFAAIESWSGERPTRDDRTVVVVRYPP
jgi:sigma-B regulation protein RsbU (phosphoserine phosphatase)